MLFVIIFLIQKKRKQKNKLMKKKVLIILFLTSTISLFAQNRSEIIKSMRSDTLPKFSIGIGTGINNYTALLGISANLRLFNTVSLQGGLGLGSWGYKYSIGIKYNGHYNGGWYYGIGYSGCTGENNLKLNLETSTSIGSTQPVTVDYLPAGTLNLKTGYDWRMGLKNTFYLEFGYAIPLQTDPWRIHDGVILSSTSSKTLQIMQPGGIIIGIGMNFGIKSQE